MHNENENQSIEIFTNDTIITQYNTVILCILDIHIML